MKIAVDIDGVLIDLMVEYCRIFNSIYGTSYKKDDVTSWEFFNDWGISENEAFTVFNQIYEDSMSVPFIDDDAPSIIKSLNLRNEVFIVSARESKFKLPIIKKLKFHNIKQNIHYKELILLTHRPYDLKLSQGFDLYVDDNPNLVEPIKELNNKFLLLYDQPWNQNSYCENNVIRVHNWREVQKVIDNLQSNLKKKKD
jgi:uncharacterized HAD superfamily protein